MVESKATLGLPLAVTSPSLRREGAYGTAGGTRTVFGPVKEMLNESVERCGGWERERTCSCAGIGVASVQGRPGRRTGEGKAEYKADGGRIADGS